MQLLAIKGILAFQLEMLVRWCGEGLVDVQVVPGSPLSDVWPSVSPAGVAKVLVVDICAVAGGVVDCCRGIRWTGEGHGDSSSVDGRAYGA
jgi:hypothetical protein